MFGTSRDVDRQCVCIGVEWGEGGRNVFCLRIRRPPRSTQSRSSAASDVYKRQQRLVRDRRRPVGDRLDRIDAVGSARHHREELQHLSLIHLSEPTRPY